MPQKEELPPPCPDGEHVPMIVHRTGGLPAEVKKCLRQVRPRDLECGREMGDRSEARGAEERCRRGLRKHEEETCRP
jgi:hypothetical protein